MFFIYFSAYCTGRDGSILGPWLIEANNIAGMNCSKLFSKLTLFQSGKGLLNQLFQR